MSDLTQQTKEYNDVSGKLQAVTIREEQLELSLEKKTEEHKTAKGDLEGAEAHAEELQKSLDKKTREYEIIQGQLQENAQGELREAKTREGELKDALDRRTKDHENVERELQGTQARLDSILFTPPSLLPNNLEGSPSSPAVSKRTSVWSDSQGSGMLPLRHTASAGDAPKPTNNRGSPPVRPNAGNGLSRSLAPRAGMSTQAFVNHDRPQMSSIIRHRLCAMSYAPALKSISFLTAL
ncbi:MAG: hypothetical protein Q9166_004571 [cf. Caloplaca sp. 2 TL-2023]